MSWAGRLLFSGASSSRTARPSPWALLARRPGPYAKPAQRVRAGIMPRRPAEWAFLLSVALALAGTIVGGSAALALVTLLPCLACMALRRKVTFSIPAAGSCKLSAPAICNRADPNATCLPECSSGCSGKRTGKLLPGVAPLVCE